MSRIALDQKAIDQLMNDPSLQDWRGGEHGQRMPFLRHYDRHNDFLPDGAVIQRGNFFMLEMIDLENADQMTDMVIESVALPNGLTLLIGARAMIMSGCLTIGWANQMFTCRRGAPQP